MKLTILIIALFLCSCSDYRQGLHLRRQVFRHHLQDEKHYKKAPAGQIKEERYTFRKKRRKDRREEHLAAREIRANHWVDEENNPIN